MQIAGYISTPLQARTVNGVSFHQFRLAVLTGKGEARRTTWFTVRAQLTELDVDMLEKGLRVEVTGVLVLHPYVNREGLPAVEAIIDTRRVIPTPVNPSAIAAPSQNVEPSATSARPVEEGAPPAAGRPQSLEHVLQTSDTSIVLRDTVPVPANAAPVAVGAFADDSLPF